MPSVMTKNRQIIPSSTKVKYFPFSGGLNIVDAALTLEPGEAIAATNFECDIRGRYRRVDGYERYDGRTLPSNVTYYRMQISAGDVDYTPFSSGFSTGFEWTTVVANSIMHGATSGAVGRVLETEVTSGDFGDEDAVAYIYFIAESGTFETSETLYLLGANAATNAGFDQGFK